MKKSSPNALLFEIGVEEIPSEYFEGAKASMLAKAPGLLSECGFLCEGVSVFATPRRLVFYAAELKKADHSQEEKTGPSRNQAFQNGQPTRALEGFLKSTGCMAGDVYFKQTFRGECVCVKISKKFKPIQYFFETLPKLIEFPKLMRWDATRYAFTRPIRWTFAFVGAKAQKYQIANVKSSNFTMGHRFLGNKKIVVRNSDLRAFKGILSRNHVILDESDRFRKIKAALQPYRNANEELIQSVSFLVEEPFPVLSLFPKGYLKLPPAVLETCMSKQLKVFACYGASGKLTNRFLVIANGERPDSKIIAKNYERVLCARLNDAQFFVKEDTKTKLEDKVEKLKDMVFLGSLGSYWEKTKRIEAGVEFLGRAAGLEDQIINRAKRAAFLSKADLTTHLVYEFPELQGVAGAEYARHDGEDPEVAGGIIGHYLPRNLTQDFRGLKKELNPEAVLLGLADRMDILVGAQGIGIEPSGSQDPYALRRSAGGIVKLLRVFPRSFSLKSWIENAYKLYGNKLRIEGPAIRSKLIDLFRERIIYELQVHVGTRKHELLTGILASDFDDTSVIYRKYDTLVKHIQDAGFEKACKVLQRPYRILKGVKESMPDHVDVSLFQDELEKTLFQIISEKGPAIARLADNEAYWEATKLYGDSFFETLHGFFDKVKVNIEDERIRSNRQALMRQVFRIYAEKVADLSCITNLSSI